MGTEACLLAHIKPSTTTSNYRSSYTWSTGSWHNFTGAIIFKSFSLPLSQPSSHHFSSALSHPQIIPFLLNPNEFPIYSPHAHAHLSIRSMSGCISLVFYFLSLWSSLAFSAVSVHDMLISFYLPFRYWQTLCYVCVDSSFSFPSHIQQSVFLGCFHLRAFLCHDCNTRWICNRYILTKVIKI